MARTSLTPVQRFRNIQVAAADIPAAVARAESTLNAHGPSAPETLAAFEIVENLGATVHRQGRILAGKSRGG